jgi:hypothetical protein
MNVLLSTTYFGPVQWYQKLYRADEVWIERYESFQKQTYRNRCVIATTQGTQALTVPVERGHLSPLSPEPSSLLSPLSSLKDIRISDHGNWRHLHWNALQSAYGDSPFFMYYEDDLRPFFTERWEFLYDYNEAIRRTVCDLLDIHPNVDYTTAYLPPQASDAEDFREAIRPKHPPVDPDFQPKPYYQVFAQKHGFLANLSILDLLCNMGPEGIFYL